MLTAKGKLFSLANDCKKHTAGKGPKNKVPAPKPKPTKVSGKHYDEGQAISLAYSLELYPQSTRDAYAQGDPSVQLSFMDDANRDSFYVEPFESDQTIEVAYQEVEEQEKLDKIVRSDNETAPDEPELSASEESDAREEGPTIAPPGTISKPKDEEKPGALLSDGSVSEPERKESHAPGNQRVDTDEGTEETPSDAQISDDDFADDIQAILQGKKVYDPNQKKTVNKSGAPATDLLPEKQTPGEAVKDSSEPLDAAKNEHKIFEKIAQSMRYANSYDLGSIAMEKKFDQMEDEIEEEEVKKIPIKKDIEDAQIIDEEEDEKREASDGNVEQDTKAEVIYDPSHPIHPDSGGSWIASDQLRVGDLIVVTNGSSPNPCYGGLLTAENEIMITGEEGLSKQSVASSLEGQKQAAVLRHKNWSDEALQSLSTLGETAASADQRKAALLEIEYAPVGIHPAICAKAKSSDKSKCEAFRGTIDLGKKENNKFYIAIPLVEGLASAGLDLVDTKATANAQKAESDRPAGWQYVGHIDLKK